MFPWPAWLLHALRLASDVAAVVTVPEHHLSPPWLIAVAYKMKKAAHPRAVSEGCGTASNTARLLSCCWCSALLPMP